MKNGKKSAFTLIELLTVIAIIGILAGIIIPTTGAVRKAAKKAQTKIQFAQWAQAMTLYKQEYGFNPPINRAVYATPVPNKLNSDAFAAAITGKKIDGTAFLTTATTAELFGNKKRITFYSIADSDLSSALIVDAFGNTDIVVIYDKDGDNMITTADLDSGSSLPTVRGVGSLDNLTPAPKTTVSATSGPRASVVFYSAGAASSAADITYSWE